MNNIFECLTKEKSVIIINGVSYSGSDFSMSVNGNLVIDGNSVTTINEKVINISIDSDVEELSTTNGDVSVCGSVSEIKTTNGDVDVHGDVNDVKTTNGNVLAKTINGKVKTVNGSIKTRP